MARIDYANFLPLFPEETEAAIRVRLNAWANEGLAPGDPQWVDTREGSFFQIVTEPAVRAQAKIYDRMSEIVAMSNPLLAGGYYLDLIATSRGLPRLPATEATGTVTFTGPSGTAIPPGTRVAAPGLLPGDPAISFETQVGATIPGGGSIDVAIKAIDGGILGNVAAGAIDEIETPMTGVTVTNALPTIEGTEVETDEALAERIQASYRNIGVANVSTLRGWALAYPPIGRATVRPDYYGAGTVLLIVSGADGSPVSDATVQGLQDLLDKPTMRTVTTGAVTLPVATIPVATTTGARPATTTNPDYITIGDQIVQYTGVDATHFTGCSGGAGAVASGSTVEQSGSGEGLAPVGMYLRVKTVIQTPIDVVVPISVEPGYGIAISGATDVTPYVQAALEAYIDGAEAGDTLFLSQVFARVVESQGVRNGDFSGVTINGSHADFVIPDNPPEQVYLRTLTLTLM